MDLNGSGILGGEIMPIYSQTPITYICQVSRHSTENNIDKTKMAAVASFSVSHENGLYQ